MLPAPFRLVSFPVSYLLRLTRLSPSPADVTPRGGHSVKSTGHGVESGM